MSWEQLFSSLGEQSMSYTNEEQDEIINAACEEDLTADLSKKTEAIFGAW